ncbi:MAG: dGTP triphosphohydrolase [bacterium]
MDWAKLFSHHRLGQTAPPMRRALKAEGRSDFQRDFDRVLFSSAFRRLQSKTQVVPLPENDFVHTRLTHSLEASCVGRSLGRIVGNRVIASQPDLFRDIGVTASDFESVVAAACLAHDIGNPPFGHSGEDAISEYFMSDKAAPFLRDLTLKQIADLQRFEGNAAGFRLLTHTSPTHSALNTGLGLTYATLGAFTKYPKESLPQLKDAPAASEKKFGFFQAEKQTFENIARELHLLPKETSEGMWHRHPLAFLVEAADDLCYTIIDFEDGFKLDLVPFAVAEALLIELIEDFHKIEARHQKIFDRREKIGYLRANAINRLIWQSADLFTENLPDLLSGKFDSNLTGLLPAHKTLREIVALSFDKIYRSRPVVEIETAGFEVLAGLLDVFLNAVFKPGSKHSQLVAHLIPDKYLDKNRTPFADKYLSIINITEFVAGMTDTFAIDTYRKLKGISLPG